jgi:hypothetical protein
MGKVADAFDDYLWRNLDAADRKDISTPVRERGSIGSPSNPRPRVSRAKGAGGKRQRAAMLRVQG